MPVKTLIQMRRDTAANWKQTNPILASGEVGVEVDTNRSKIGNGTFKWNQLHYQSVPYYGAFQDTTTQSIASTTVAYPITLNTVDFSHGVRLDPNYSSRIIFDHPGVWNIQWSGQFTNTNTSGSQDISVWLRKNGIDVPGSAGHVTIASSHGGTPGATIASWNYFVSVAADDYLELVWHADDVAVALTAYAAGSSPVVPTAASVIVTVEQVA